MYFWLDDDKTTEFELFSTTAVEAFLRSTAGIVGGIFNRQLCHCVFQLDHEPFI